MVDFLDGTTGREPRVLGFGDSVDCNAPTAQRVQALMAQAKGIARHHVLDMRAKVEAGVNVAREIENGGDAYPAGIREVARKVADDGESLIGTLDALLARGI